MMSSYCIDYVCTCSFLQAWISFMVAFMAWFSIPPVMDHIAKDLNIPSAEMYDSNMAAVAVTIGRPIISKPPTKIC